MTLKGFDRNFNKGQIWPYIYTDLAQLGLEPKILTVKMLRLNHSTIEPLLKCLDQNFDQNLLD